MKDTVDLKVISNNPERLYPSQIEYLTRDFNSVCILMSLKAYNGLLVKEVYNVIGVGLGMTRRGSKDVLLELIKQKLVLIGDPEEDIFNRKVDIDPRYSPYTPAGAELVDLIIKLHAPHLRQMRVFT